MIEERFFGLREVRSARTVLFFASFRSEVDTFGMICRSLDHGKKVVLPRVNARELELLEIMAIGELAPGYMGIPEPFISSAERQVSVNDIDVIIVPGAVFDDCGNRIGYGGGYYDRLLSHLQSNTIVIAPAYEEQVIPSVPAEPHDRKVHIIITDKRTIRCFYRDI